MSINPNMKRSPSFFVMVLFTSMVIELAVGQPLPPPTQCGVIYVSPNAAGSGIRTDPAGLVNGLSQVSSTDNIIWMAVGTYTISNAISLPDNVTLEGGFNPITWIKNNATPTIISRDVNNPLPPPANALVGIAGLNASGFRLQDLTINVATAPGPEISVYGVYLMNCSDYNVVRCEVNTGTGGIGLPGLIGGPGAIAGNGNPGQNGYNSEVALPGGSGGIGGGGNNGGNGANGGKHSSFSPGSGGLPVGCGGGGGVTADGPECSAGCFFGDPSCGSVGAGSPGLPGGAGNVGNVGTTGVAGTYSVGYYMVGGAGGNGTDGNPGCGGGGGGGGAGRQRDGTDDTGGSGGGGGGGGFGGIGGSSGTGGGGSFAAFLWNNGANGNIADCLLNAGPGGSGGIGGTGGPSGAGGIGGAGGGPGPCGGSSGAPGGPGGAGGPGGPGGSGITGPSVDLAQEGGGTAVSASGIAAVPGNPPIISVESYGCTNAEIIFTSPTSGAWDFGPGANPATGNGIGPIVVAYPTTGRRTITFNGTAFTDFLGIYNDGPILPTITPANGTVDAGCPNQFNTTLDGTQYDWDFGPVATPATESGPSLQTTSDVYFSTPGTYWIKVTVITPCCGPVTDSTQVTVQANSFDATLTASPTSICEGDLITFTADPSTYANYEFFIDGVSVQNGSANVYASSTIQQGDSIWVDAIAGTCFANPSDTIIPTVNPIPTVTLVSDDVDNEICEGETITFTASPAGMDNYEFFNGTNSLQSGTSEILFGTVPANNSIIVVATDNGCPSLPSAAIVTIVNPLPQISLTSSVADDMICEGDNIIFTVLPIGLADYEFFEGFASVQTGASNIYTTSTLVSGAAISVIATSAEGCVGAPSNVITTTVNPYPSVTLSSSDPDNEICEGESITFTATPSGLDMYEFFDGATSVQNSASDSWTTTGLATGNSITVVPTNLGCTGQASATITITIIAAPTVDPGVDIANCIDAADVTLAGFTPAGGTWVGTGITNLTGIFSPSTAGVGTFTLSYSASNANCTTTETITATVNNLPIIIAGTYNPICLGESVTLNASGAATYVWDPSTGLSNPNIGNPAASPSATTAYTVTGTDANGCVSSDQTTVTVDPVPTADFTVLDVCIGDETIFVNNSTPISGAAYQWDFGDGNFSTDQDPTNLYQVEGTFNVQLVVTLGNCTDSNTGSVTVNPRPSSLFSATPDYTSVIEPLITFQDFSVNAVSWSWNFGDFSPFATDQNPTHVYADTGVHIITLTTFNVFGCTDSIQDSIYISPFTTLYVPSAFTPDSDRNNDKFRAYGKDIFYYELIVFDRWGNQLFHSHDIDEGWDGSDMHTGKDVKGGLYVYQILYDDFRGRRKKKLGRVSLIR